MNVTLEPPFSCSHASYSPLADGAGRVVAGCLQVGAEGETVMAQGQAWVDLVGDLIVARVRGEPNEPLLRETRRKPARMQ